MRNTSTIKFSIALMSILSFVFLSNTAFADEVINLGTNHNSTDAFARNGGDPERLASPFVPSANVTGISLSTTMCMYLANTGHTYRFDIMGDSAGEPDEASLGYATIGSGSLNTSATGFCTSPADDINVTFTITGTINSGVTYWLVVEDQDSPTGNAYPTWGLIDVGNNTSELSYYASGVWTSYVEIIYGSLSLTESGGGGSTSTTTTNYPIRFETFTGVTYTVGGSLFLFFMVWQLSWIMEKFTGKKNRPARR